MHCPEASRMWPMQQGPRRGATILPLNLICRDARMTITLSRRQIGEADRVGGIELLLPWPDELGAPPAMEDDSEADVTPRERAWVEQHVQPVCQAAGLVAVRAQITRAYGPHRDGNRQQTCLGVIIVGQRWAGAKGQAAAKAKVMWYLA